MEWLFFGVLLGLIPAMIARSKGREFLPWWLYGALLFIVALPHALLMKPKLDAVERQQAAQGLKKCPFCAEMIKPDAVVCRYCGRDLPAPILGATKLCAGYKHQIPVEAESCPLCGAR